MSNITSQIALGDKVRLREMFPGHERHEPMMVFSLTTWADGSPATAGCRFVDGNGEWKEIEFSVVWLEKINGETAIGFAADA